MPTPTVPYIFKSKPYQYAGSGAWIFVALPKKMSKEIRALFGNQEQGWGRLTAVACIGKSEWKTAIWFDTKQDTYLLPLKADIRKKEKIEIGKMVAVKINI